MAGNRAGAMSVSETLPRLRAGLDFLPSPIADSPGLILRDSFRYSQAVLLIPPAWVPALAFLDGSRTELDVQSYLTRAGGGRLVLLEDIRRFIDALRGHGFLDSQEFYRRGVKKFDRQRLPTFGTRK